LLHETMQQIVRERATKKSGGSFDPPFCFFYVKIQRVIIIQQDLFCSALRIQEHSFYDNEVFCSIMVMASLI